MLYLCHPSVPLRWTATCNLCASTSMPIIARITQSMASIDCTSYLLVGVWSLDMMSWPDTAYNHYVSHGVVVKAWQNLLLILVTILVRTSATVSCTLFSVFVCTYGTWHGKLKTFSEEFHGCSAQTPADSCVAWRRSFAGRPRIFRAGRHESFADLGGKSRNQKANFVCNNAEGSRKTSQGSFELLL